MKVRFTAPEKTREFKQGQILEAQNIKPGLKSAPLIAIKNQWGENYAYPAAWFEIIEE